MLRSADAPAVRRHATRAAAEDAAVVFHDGAADTGFVVQDGLGTVHHLGTSTEDVLRTLAAFRIDGFRARLPPGVDLGPSER